MEPEYWVVAVIALVAALVAGFVGGRLSAPRQRRVESMRQERDRAQREADEVRAEVNRHFEESARMFGKLADDYRSFFQQFARTAQNLGLSEDQARALLHQADPSLVGQRSGEGARTAGDDARTGAVPRGAVATAGTEGDPAPHAPPGREPRAEEPPAGEPAGAEPPTEQPRAEKPETPAAEKPTREEPTADEPAGTGDGDRPDRGSTGAGAPGHRD